MPAGPRTEARYPRISQRSKSAIGRKLACKVPSAKMVSSSFAQLLQAGAWTVALLELMRMITPPIGQAEK